MSGVDIAVSIIVSKVEGGVKGESRTVEVDRKTKTRLCFMTFEIGQVRNRMIFSLIVCAGMYGNYILWFVIVGGHGRG